MGMKGVFERVREFHIFNGGRPESEGGSGGACHGGCWRVVAILLRILGLWIGDGRFQSREGRTLVWGQMQWGSVEVTARSDGDGRSSME